MRALIIDAEQLGKVKAVIDYAEKHPLSIDMLLDHKNKEPDAFVPGDFPEYTCIIPIDYRCAFTIEEHPKGKIRHLSVSVPTPGKYPSSGACEMLMAAFDFTHSLKECNVYMEDIGPGHQCVNIAELI